ncbi:hypothetical protein [Catenovulum sediminis]|uniref:Uncharacterized protein n=1 Tax=Catenovulum sediminis TaxID=1740262 RepID=A0ABV1RH87_9ALTE
MRIAIETFRGMVPKPDSRLLPVEVANLAINCRFDRGQIEPYSNYQSIEPLPVSNVKSLFRYADNFWFAWNKDVDVVNSPIDQDDYGRVYFTGDGKPKVTYNTIATAGQIKPSASYSLGVPAPENGPNAIVSSAVQDEEGFANDITLFYVYTYVTELGEEGQPSALSGELTIFDPTSHTVSITFPDAVPTGHNITHIRIYRNATTTNSGGYFHVADIPIASKDTPYVDSTIEAELGGDLVSINYDLPPEDMAGLTSMPNGILAGFSGNSVCFSVAFQPHAWPFDYRQTTEHNIVGLSVFGNSLFVATEGKPYVFSGVSPDSMTGQKLEINQACVSKRSIVDMGEYVIYASPEGLVAASSGDMRVITQDLMRKDQWQQYQPETIHAYQVEGKYLAFHGGNAAFIFDPSDKSFIEINAYADAGFNILKQDELYLSVDDDLVLWDADLTKQNFRWRKRFELNNRVSPKACRVEKASDGDLTFTLFVDGVQSFQAVNPTNETFRLPPKRGDHFEIEVSGTCSVRRIVLASSPREL